MRATRRAALAASAAAVAGLAACTSESSSPAAESPTTGAATGSPATNGSADPDRVLLDEAANLSAAMLIEARNAGPRLDPGGRWADLHRTHLEAIGQALGPSASPVPRSLPPRRWTEAKLRRLESRAQRELARMAGAAQSGALARMFASMSAGVAAHLADPGRPTP